MKKTSAFIVLFPVLLLLMPGVLQADEPLQAISPASRSGNPRQGIFLDEVGIGSGYVWGDLKRTPGTFRAYPALLRIGFDINSLFGMPPRQGTVQLAFEPFANAVEEPDKGVEAGVDVFIRYLYPIARSVMAVSEIGSGPAYLGINTREQGGAGINILTQIGFGTRIDMSESLSLNLGYRFRHLSCAGIRQPNSGINSNLLTMGLSVRLR
jgi:opacity protein-like surface antigen